MSHQCNYKCIEIFYCLIFLIIAGVVRGQESKLEYKDTGYLESTQKAHPIFFQKLGEEEDLPKGIGNVLRDRLGFLWINADDGIYRYDGIQFKKIEYVRKDSTDPVVNAYHHLFLGKSDTLWAVGSYSQLCYFDWYTERFKAIPLQYQNMEAPRLLSMLEDSRGIIWTAYFGHGLNKVNPKTGELSRTAVYEHLPESLMKIHHIMEDSRGNIWGLSESLFCLSFKKGTRKIEGVTLYPELTINRSSEQGTIWAISEDSTGYIWAAGYKGSIWRIDPENQNLKKFEDGLSQKNKNRQSEVYDMTVARDGKIWIAVNQHGISIFDPVTTKFTNQRYNRFDPLSIGNGSVRAIYQDQERIMWVSIDGGGLNYYDSDAALFGHFRSIPSESNSLNGNRVQAFYEDSSGEVWIGTNEGLNQFDRRTGRFQQYDDPNSLLKNPFSGVLSIVEDTNNPPFFTDKIWIGTSKGLLTFNPKTRAFSKRYFSDGATKSLETDQIRHLVKTKNETIWVNTCFPHRIFQLKNETGTFEEIELLAYKSKGDIAYVFLDDRQNFWIYSHENGLFKLELNTGVQSHLTIQSNQFGTFEPSAVITIWQDAKNRYWLGGSGLYLLTTVPNKENEYTFEDFSERAGISDATVFGILQGDNGEAWVSTSKGMVKIDPETLTFQNYRTSDGLQGMEFFQRAFYKSPSSGELYFGGQNGFNVFHPKDIQKDTLPPPIVITQVEVFRDSIMQKVNLETAKGENNIPIIELFYGDKILDIQYVGLHFGDPKRNQYALQLEGYDENWRYVGNKTEVTYTNLNAGKYLFKVKAANKDGFWNETGTSLKVIVRPPWWATWWAYVAYLILIASAIYFLYRFQLRRNTEKAEAAYLKEMDNLKTQFFSNITHEFRTPLTLILGPAKQLHDNEPQPEKQKGLASIVKNANHLLGLINQLLDLSKLESQQMSVEIKHGDLIKYTQDLLDIFKPLAKRKEQNLHFFASHEIWETNFDQDKWNKIIFNLLSNAIKFSQNKGNIELSLSKLRINENEFIHLKVKDDGQGIGKDNLKQIFNRFYQVDASATRIQEGAGIGLSLVKELVELQGGSIQVESEIDTGTTFEIKIPILKSSEKVRNIQTDSLKNLPIWVEGKTEILTKPTDSSEELLEVLIIEDNTEMGSYIRSCLDPAQYIVTFANDGEEGIEKAFETIPDLIISDIMMPKKDGFEVVTAIREHLPTSHIPIVLLTAKAALESRLEGLERGADAYLTKPFSPEELVLRIRKLIELRQFLQRRYQNQDHESDSVAETYQKEDAFITNLRAYIIENIDNSDLTVVDISKHFFMSRVQLYRKIKALTNHSVSVFIRKVRLEIAYELVKAKDLTLSEIAYQTGFTSPTYFSTVFKQQYGKAPSEKG